jgi:hypothetical protein
LVDSGWVAALAGFVQALAVVPAVIIAAMTLSRDRKDRRVDRVLALYEELVGDLDDVRREVVDRVRLNRLRLKGERISQSIGTEEPGSAADKQVGKLLRFFERAEAMRVARSVDMRLLTDLVGSHAAWWDIAIVYDETSKARRALHRLALASNQYAEVRRANRRFTQFSDWGRSRAADFSPQMLNAYKDLCRRSNPRCSSWSWLQRISDESAGNPPSSS